MTVGERHSPSDADRETAEGGRPVAPGRIGVGLIGLVLAVTLGEGGGTPDATLATHAAIGIAWGVVIAFGVRPRLPDAGPWRALVAFVGLATISGMLAPYGYAAFLQLQEIAVFVAVLVLASTAGRGFAQRLVLPLLVGAAAHGGYVVYLRVVDGVARPGGTFLNPNHLGAWLVAALWLAAGTAVRSSRERMIRGMLAVPAAAGLAATASRGAILGAVVGGVVWAALSWRLLGRRTKRGVLAVAALGLMAAAVILGVRLRETDAFAFHRVWIWRATIAVAAERPVLGVGPGQFPAAAAAHLFDDGVPPMRFDRRFSNTHSDWLRPVAETGILGTAAVLATVGLGAFALRRRARTDPREAGIVGCAAALAALLAQSGVENLSERPALVVLAAALSGAALASDRTVRSARPWSRVTACVVLAGLLLLGDVAPWLAWRSATRAATAAPADRIPALDDAVRRNPAQPFHRAALADAWMTSEAPDPGAYAHAREAAEAAVRLQPADAAIVRSLARVEATGCLALYRDAGTRDRALAAYRTAADLAPFDATLALETAEFLVRVGDPVQARVEAERALVLEPESVAARLLLAELALGAGADAGPDEGPASSLERARETAARYAGRSWDNPYTRTLMRADADRIRRIRRALDDSPAGE